MLTMCDRFLPWPAEGFRAIASSALAAASDYIPATLLAPSVEACVALQQSATALMDRYRADTGRQFYVTPTSYLELVALYTQLLAWRQAEVRLGVTSLG